MNGISMVNEWDMNGILMGYEWYNGILMGYQWYINGLWMGY